MGTELTGMADGMQGDGEKWADQIPGTWTPREHLTLWGVGDERWQSSIGIRKTVNIKNTIEKF